MSLLTMSAQLAEGFLITVEIFVLTLLFSLPLGLIVAFGRMSGCKVIRIISKIYISIMRGTPLMLQIIVVYFAPFYVFRMQDVYKRQGGSSTEGFLCAGCSER